MSAVKMSRFGRLLLSRPRATEVGQDLPPNARKVTLDFEGVEAASPSFMDQIVREAGARGAEVVVMTNLSERLRDTVVRLQGLHRQGSAEVVAS